jgi:MFS transporter, AAHS family, 4-hydroxybenzoate transporter
LLMIIDGYDYFVTGYVLPAIAKGFGVAPQAVTPVVFTQQFGFIAGTYLVAPLADRFGRRTLLLASALGFGIITVATVTASSISVLSAYRIAAGVFIASLMPNAIALATEYAPKRFRAVMVAVVMCGFTVGAGPMGAVASALTVDFGWQGAFVLGGVVPLVLLPFLWFMLPESVRFVALRGNSPAETARLLKRIEPSLEAGPETRFVIEEERAKGVAVSGLFREGRAVPTLLLWVAFFGAALLLGFDGVWFVTLINVFAGLSVPAAGAIAGSMGVGGMLGYLVCGFLIDRYDPARVLAAFCAVAAVATFAVGLMMGNTSLLTAFAVIMGFAAIGGNGGLNAVAAIVYPTWMRVTGVGWAIGVGRIGGMVGSALGGFVLAQHWTAVPILLTAAIPVAVSCLAIAFVTAASPARSVAQPRVS